MASCKHIEMVDVDGIGTCNECGEEVDSSLTFDPEWRFYGAADNRISKDPSRCHYNKKTASRSIDKVVENLNIPDGINNYGMKLVQIDKKTRQIIK